MRLVEPPDRIDSPSVEVTLEIERSVVGALLIDPTTRPTVAEILAPTDFHAMPLGAVYEALQAVDTEHPTDLEVIAELDRRGKLKLAGGPDAVHTLSGTAATAANVVPEARLVRHYARVRTLQGLHQRAGAGEPYDQAEIDALHEEVRQGASPATELQHPIGFTGDRLRETRERPDPRSPLPGFLDPEPGLHVELGRSSVGKTSLAAWIAMHWANGSSPWEGAPPLPQARAFILSREQNVQRIDRRCREMDLCSRSLDRDVWTNNLSIIARDPMLPRKEQPLLRLDDTGLALLRKSLHAARVAGEPYRFGVLDSLSRLKPAEYEENSNDDMTRWLDALEEVAEEFGVYLVLLHHQHKMETGNARTAGRGASAIDAVAQGTWLLEAGDEPYTRKLRVHGNALDERIHEFEVAPPEDPWKVLFWRRREGLVHAYPIGDYLAPGEECSFRALAKALSGEESPTRAWREKAPRIARSWAQAGLARVLESEGKGKGARVIRNAPGGPEGGEESDDVPF
ncbi:MAG: AAA family ATPase [Myxococcota bacterium]